MIPEISEYFRLVGYAIIVMSSLNGIAKRKFDNVLFVGDILISLALLLSSLGLKLFGLPKAESAPYILTPAVFVWATIHFVNMLKRK
jgi:hypothetical protein